MRNLLESLIGKEIDVHCGTSTFSGKAVKIMGNVLQLEKDEEVCYISIEQIVAVWDSEKRKGKPPGFTGDHSAER